MPQVFRGTRDYLGSDARWRNLLVSTISQIFESFGFEPLETPIIENEQTLSGKYGEEGEKKRFRLNLPMANNDEGTETKGAGLRYDHTVPLARSVAINWNCYPLPYRRYVIGPVFRDESPQAGRLRQFTQCDFDTVGSTSPIIDAEIVAMNYRVLSRLGFTNEYLVYLNDRRLLNALAGSMGYSPQEAVCLFRAWDKLEKIPLALARSELIINLRQLRESGRGYYMNDEIDDVETYISRSELLYQFDDVTNTLLALRNSNNNQILESIRRLDINNDHVGTALDSLEQLLNFISAMGVPETIYQFSPLLARGLDYYTGPIFETVVTTANIGSISGGGRFDQLIAQMGGPDLPASGSSFGLERLMTVMERLSLRPESNQSTQAFITIFDPSNLKLCQSAFEIATKLRLTGINVEVYTGQAEKLGKQLSIADRKQIPFVVILGPDELVAAQATLRNMGTRQQSQVPISDLPQILSQKLES